MSLETDQAPLAQPQPADRKWLRRLVTAGLLGLLATILVGWWLLLGWALLWLIGLV